MLLGLVYFLVFCLGIVLFILFCPFYYSLKIAKQEKWETNFVLKQGGLRLCLQYKDQELEKAIFLFGRLIKRMKKKEKGIKKRKTLLDKQEKETKKRRIWRRIFNWQELLSREAFACLRELLFSIGAVFYPRKMFFEGKIGFDDPYYTGLLAAFLMGWRKRNWLINLDFTGSVCEFDLQMEGKVCLIVLLYYCLQFLWLYPLCWFKGVKLKRCT